MDIGRTQNIWVHGAHLLLRGIIRSLWLFSRCLTSFLCLHPSLSSAARLSPIKPPSFAKLCSIWIRLLPLVGLPLILSSIISCKSPSCLKTWPIHQCFFCQTEFRICLSSLTLLGTLSSQLIFYVLLHIHISRRRRNSRKASNLLLSVCVNVHVCAACSATLQTKNVIILLFSSRFILPVNYFLCSINTFFAIPILLRISFVKYPSSDIKLPKYLNWLSCSTCCPST